MLGTGGIVCQTHSCCQRGVGSHLKTPLKGLLVAKGITFKPKRITGEGNQKVRASSYKTSKPRGRDGWQGDCG